mgnify:CR=1 FL=1
MIYNKRVQQVRTLVRDFLDFCYLKFPKKETFEQPTLLVDFTNPNLYHRFFYLVLKFYQLAGYKIVYPMNFAKFRNLRNGDHYLSLIVKEKNFLSINRKLPEKYITIKDSDFNADYFKNYFNENNQEQNAFHIPMSFHPNMYHKNLWNHEIETNTERLNAIFCFGNFDEQAYSEIKKTPFQVENRVRLLQFFSKKKDFVSIKNSEHLATIIKENNIQNLFFL